jgi:hypothetical protein
MCAIHSNLVAISALHTSTTAPGIPPGPRPTCRCGLCCGTAPRPHLASGGPPLRSCRARSSSSRRGAGSRLNHRANLKEGTAIAGGVPPPRCSGCCTHGDLPPRQPRGVSGHVAIDEVVGPDASEAVASARPALLVCLEGAALAALASDAHQFDRAAKVVRRAAGVRAVEVYTETIQGTVAPEEMVTAARQRRADVDDAGRLALARCHRVVPRQRGSNAVHLVGIRAFTRLPGQGLHGADGAVRSSSPRIRFPTFKSTVAQFECYWGFRQELELQLSPTCPPGRGALAVSSQARLDHNLGTKDSYIKTIITILLIASQQRNTIHYLMLQTCRLATCPCNSLPARAPQRTSTAIFPDNHGI